ncbi:MAG: FkbM family methyltransferase [Acidobacteriota bacterium]|nr:FkbM family methyltransferase [Acidobacteriota bacterium]
MNDDALRTALSRLGGDPAIRAEMIRTCQKFEQLPEHLFTTVRDDITGPIVDALHENVERVRKELSSGIVFEFHYRSKIARDFVMSIPEKPDHVWEPQTTKLLLRLSERARHVLIGGAYFGDQAVLIADRLRNRGSVHAFEPNTDQAAMLEHNARLNGLENIRVNRVGLWSDDSSRLRLVGPDALASSVAASDGEEGPTFPTTTIDSYLRSSEIERLDLIMLDLEGAELAALQGARSQLSQPAGTAPHLVFEVHRSYVDWSDGLHNTGILRYLASLGYTMFAVRDFQSNYDLGDGPIELVPAATAYLEGPPHGFNVLAIKDAALVQNDGFLIRPHVSPKLLLHRDPALHHPAGGLRPR